MLTFPVSFFTNAVGGSEAVSKTSLLGYWALGEASGTRVDSHTGGRDLVLTNTGRDVGNGTGINGSAYNRHSNDDRYSHRNNSATAWVCDSDWAVSVWVRPSTVSGDSGSGDPFTGTDSQHRRIVGFVDAANGVAGDWNLAVDATGKVSFCVWTSSGTQTNGRKTTTNALATEAWSHIVAARRSGVLEIWLNGVQEILTSDDSQAANIGVADWLFLGMSDRSGDVNTGCFKGRIDELAIWERALSAGEIATLYNAGAGTFYADFAT